MSEREKSRHFNEGERPPQQLEGIVEQIGRLLREFFMPKDAKFGLVVGVSLVLVVAVFFFRKEAPALDPAAATIVKPAANLTPPPVPVSNSRNVQAKAMSNEE